jgi:hypothetical protein
MFPQASVKDVDLKRCQYFATREAIVEDTAKTIDMIMKIKASK